RSVRATSDPCGGAVVDHSRVVSPERKEHPQAFRRFARVLDDEDAESAESRGRCCGLLLCRARLGRKPDLELASLAGAGAMRGDSPAVELDDPTRQRETDAEPSARCVLATVRLRKELEDRLELLRRDPDAGVAH